MTLLGDWNWWLPRWLGWLPHVTIEGTSAEPEVALVPESVAEPAPEPA
jgi:RND superfamily putative drug exporter